MQEAIILILLLLVGTYIFTVSLMVREIKIKDVQIRAWMAQSEYYRDQYLGLVQSRVLRDSKIERGD